MIELLKYWGAWAKDSKIYFHPIFPACFHFDPLCYTNFSFSFFLFLFYLDDSLENPLSAFFQSMLHPFGRTKQRQTPFWSISVGSLESAGRASVGLTLGAQEWGLQEAMKPWWHSRVLALLMHGCFPLLCATDTLMPWQGIQFQSSGFLLGKADDTVFTQEDCWGVRFI